MNSYIERKMEEFDREFKYLGEDEYNLNRNGIKDFMKSALQEQQEMILEKVRKDLDNGKFEMICKNEITFAQYMISIIRDISQ